MVTIGKLHKMLEIEIVAPSGTMFLGPLDHNGIAEVMTGLFRLNPLVSEHLFLLGSHDIGHLHRGTSDEI